mgnify:CR=1 FL=1
MVKKILIVEDEITLQETLTYNLEREGFQVTVEGNGVKALDVAQEMQPDLILMDIMLPDLDGLEITRIIRQKMSVPIIMLTARDAEIDRVLGLEIGADDYVTKPFNPREIVARVRALLRRQQLDQADQSDFLEVGLLQLDLGARTLTLGGKLIEVTPTEFNLLKIFMESPGDTFGREELLEKALGYG